MGARGVETRKDHRSTSRTNPTTSSSSLLTRPCAIHHGRTPRKKEKEMKRGRKYQKEYKEIIKETAK